MSYEAKRNRNYFEDICPYHHQSSVDEKNCKGNHKTRNQSRETARHTFRNSFRHLDDPVFLETETVELNCYHCHDNGCENTCCAKTSHSIINCPTISNHSTFFEASHCCHSTFFKNNLRDGHDEGKK